MTTTAPSLRRLTPQAAILLLAAAVAWLVTAGKAGEVAGMTGTMGLGLAAFVGMWTLMMAAMMLPSVAPVASMYQRSVRSYRALRLAGFTGGYLLAWVGAGVPAFLLTAFVARLVDQHPGWATAVAVAVFASCGVYQLTPLKSRCLKHCRSPLSLLLHYGAYRGALRDVRAGAHHGAYCLGCCWSLGAVRGGGRDEPGRHGGAGRGCAGREAVGPRRTPRPVGRRGRPCLGRRRDLGAGAGTGLHETSQMMNMAGS
jgi:Predicted metal-binding integral membrane protein (DUF2182)